MNELTADFMLSMPYLVLASFLIAYVAWRLFCRQTIAGDEKMTRLNGVTRIQYCGEFVHVFFRDGKTATFARKHLVLRDHHGQMFCFGHTLDRCELFLTYDYAEMRGLVVEVPAAALGESNALNAAEKHDAAK